MHLAVEMAEMSAAEIHLSSISDTPRDICRASDSDKAEATEILKRAGIRTRDQSPPSWHFAGAAFRRETEAEAGGAG
jgi:hypothetical protein